MLVHLVMDISARLAWGGITRAFLNLVVRRLDQNRDRIHRITTQIREGTYRPRTPSGKPRKPRDKIPRPPRPPDDIPQKFGWLAPMIRPEAGGRGYLDLLLRDPEMVAMIEIAPTALGRPLRSLCWMFGMKPPPHLAPQKRPRPAKTPRPEPPPKPPLARVSFPKPRGSISNRLYRTYRPPDPSASPEKTA
jgi:hypothetical protein